ncbi:MAG: molybdate ABC transporter substrate-binding protein [Gammaproteobacteria bacterium]|nr:MAG: molybdate ABC transporter substrate-binding protein [Gammaproteobacteria bacterium]
MTGLYTGRELPCIIRYISELLYRANQEPVRSRLIIVKIVKNVFRLVFLCALIFASTTISAAVLKVAVASNFATTMTVLAEHFEKKTDHQVKLIFGSTGKHYAQIRNGAPFDAFFAADIKRPKLLEEEGLAVPGSRFTYAIGKLVLWSPEADVVDSSGKVLEQGGFRYLAIANPKFAPYGRAAREVLQSRGLWDGLKGKIVRGENISQSYQFVNSGNAELGFVAYSQLKHPDQRINGSYWKIPQALYTPIEQQAVLIKDSEAGRSFLSYIQSKEALMIINDHGYETR